MNLHPQMSHTYRSCSEDSEGLVFQAVCRSVVPKAGTVRICFSACLASRHLLGGPEGVLGGGGFLGRSERWLQSSNKTLHSPPRRSARIYICAQSVDALAILVFLVAESMQQAGLGCGTAVGPSEAGPRAGP